MSTQKEFVDQVAIHNAKIALLKETAATETVSDDLKKQIAEIEELSVPSEGEALPPGVIRFGTVGPAVGSVTTTIAPTKVSREANGVDVGANTGPSDERASSHQVIVRPNP